MLSIKRVNCQPPTVERKERNQPQAVKAKCGQLSLFTLPNTVLWDLDHPCRYCGYEVARETLEPPSSPHHSRLTCEACGGWIKFVAKKDSKLGGVGNV